MATTVATNHHSKTKNSYFDRENCESVVFGERQLTSTSGLTVPESISDEGYRQFLAGRLANRVLFNQGPDGYSLTESEVAPGTHVLRHKHNLPQLILIIEGSMKHGSKHLGPGSGYFTPANGTYGFVAGPEGCRYVEFRYGGVEEITTEVVETNPNRLVHDSV